MNKKSKKIFKYALLACCLFMGTHAFAQQDSSMAKAMTDKMKTTLTLSDEQYSQVFVINQDFVGKLAALKTSGGGKLAKLRKMKSLDSNRDKQLKELLSSEQYKIFEQTKAENKEKLKELRKNRSGS